MRRLVSHVSTPQGTTVAAMLSMVARSAVTDYAWREEELAREKVLREEAAKGMSEMYSIKNPNLYVHCLPGGKAGQQFSYSSTSSSGGGGSSSSSTGSGPFSAIGSMFGGGGGGGNNNNDEKKGNGEYKATMTDSFMLATGFVISMYSFKVMYTRTFGGAAEPLDAPVPIWVAGSPEVKGKYFLLSCITDSEERHRIFAEFSQARQAAIQQVTAHNRHVTHLLRERQQKQQQHHQGKGAAEGAVDAADEGGDLPQYMGVPPHFNDFFTWMDTMYPTWCAGRRFTNIPQIQAILSSAVQGMESVGGAALHRAISELSAETAAANRAQASAEGRQVASPQWGGLTSIGGFTASGVLRDRADRVDAFLDAAQLVNSGNGGLMSLLGFGGSAAAPGVPPVAPNQPQQFGYYGMPPPQPPYNPQAYYGHPVPPPPQPNFANGVPSDAFSGMPPPPALVGASQYPPYVTPPASAVFGARQHMQQFNHSAAAGDQQQQAYHGGGTGFYGNTPGRPSTFTGTESLSLEDVVGGDVVPQKK